MKPGEDRNSVSGKKPLVEGRKETCKDGWIKVVVALKIEGVLGILTDRILSDVELQCFFHK